MAAEGREPAVSDAIGTSIATEWTLRPAGWNRACRCRRWHAEQVEDAKVHVEPFVALTGEDLNPVRQRTHAAAASEE